MRVSNERWAKAGVEFADGRAQIGAVVTDGLSDWSLAPAADWAGQRILIRVSRSARLWPVCGPRIRLVII
jgi:uncharacterized protein